MPKNYKIVAGTSEAGGGECLLPVIKYLLKKHYRVTTIAGVNAVKVYKNAEYNTDIEINSSNCYEAVGKVLDRVKPDVILSGLVGSKENIDYSLIRLAKEKNIPVLAILDSWMNYRKRLYDPLTRKELGLLPDMIAVMDEIALQEIIKEGISEDHCAVTGHPKYDLLRGIQKDRRNKVLREKILKKYKIQPKDFIIFYCAEPITGFYPDKFFGYNEQDVINILFAGIEKLSRQLPCSLIFKEHPIGRSLNAAIEKTDYGFIYTDDADVNELLRIADVVAGISSTILIFAAAIGIPVLIVQPNLIKERDMNILTRAGYFSPIGTERAFYNGLQKAYGLKRNSKLARIPNWLKLDGKVSRRIENLIKDLIKKDK